MDMNTVTVVSALFDIGRDTWEHHGLSQGMYLNWYKNTLALNSNHIIFTDDVFYDRLVAIIDEHGTSDNVKIIKRQLTDLPAYRCYFGAMSAVMASDTFKKKIYFNVPESLYPLYNIIMFNKMFFLRDAMKNNPFNSDTFIWVDAGGLRENISNYRGVIWPAREKMEKLCPDKINVFCHHPEIKIHNVHDHVLSQMRYIQGTAFFAPKDCIEKLISVFDKKVLACLSAGYIGSDEKILDLCYLEQPELFNLEVSTWREYFGRYR